MIITTTYKGATDNLGSRITAKCDGKQVTTPYPYHLSGSDAHLYAAMMLLGKPYNLKICKSTEYGHRLQADI